MTVWPSLSATTFGRFWGRLFAIEVGFPVFGIPLTIGRLMALVSIPFMVALYFLMRLPRFPGIIIGIRNPWCWVYRLTNRRVVVENGQVVVTGKDGKIERIPLASIVRMSISP